MPDELVRQLDEFAEDHRWSRATAVKVLVEQGLQRKGGPGNG
jgi:metal-responsive CopG/Arc/MetJ family transcriptional regulator